MSLTFANKITIGRILAVPFLIATLMYYDAQRDYLRWVALGFFLFAVVSDVIDGYVARSRHQKTPAGKILDPLADKLLLISSFFCLYVIRPRLPVMHFPLWLVVTVISRDVILIVGAMLLYVIFRRLPMESTRWGKSSTFFQVVSVIGMLLQLPASSAMWFLAALMTIISGIDYLRQGIKWINKLDDKEVSHLQDFQT